jgi:hypothetical protein
MEETILSKISKIAIAIAIAVSFVIGMVAVGPTLAADHHGDDHGHAARHDNDRRDRDRGHYESVQPNYYYAPPPNYYSAPEPEYPPSQGVNLFFKL